MDVGFVSSRVFLIMLPAQLFCCHSLVADLLTFNEFIKKKGEQICPCIHIPVVYKHNVYMLLPYYDEYYRFSYL